jgi:iron complex outermembrane receptor protein
MKRKYLATVISSLFALPITAHSETILEDVVTTSNRFEQKSFDAPASLQAVSREVIEDAGPQVNMSESLNRIPGVVALNRQNYAQDLQISIRGFGARTAFGIRGVRLIVDGIPATIPDGQGQSATVSLTSTDRIEVLRGPLAQLYGNAAGGVIQTFTREAPDRPELLIQGHTGSFGTNRTDWQYADKVGKFGLVADYSTFKTDGFRQNSQAERNQFNGKLTYQHNDQTRIDFIANVFDMPYANDPAGLSQANAISNPTMSTRTENQRKIIKQNQIGTVLTHSIDGVSKVSGRIYGGNRKMTHFSNVQPTTGCPLSGCSNTNNSWNGLDRDYYGLGLNYSSKSNIAGKDTLWVAGFDFDKSTEINQAGAATPNNAEKLNSNTRNEDRLAQSTDFYAQASMLLNEKWSILGGARSTNVKLASTNLRGTPTSLGEVTFNAVNPVLGVTYHATERMNIYANYGRGLETPTLAEMGYENKTGSTTEIVNSFNKSLVASKSNHYETGLKWIPSNRSRLDLAIFYVETSDEIITDRSASPNSSFKNSPGGTTRKGLELVYQNQFSSSIKFNLTGTLIDAEFNDTFPNGLVRPGHKIPGIPNGMAYSSIQWSDTDYQRNKYRQVMGTLATFEFIAAGANHSRDTNLENLKAGGYSLYNLRLAHRLDINSMTLTGYGQLNNLTDKKYMGSMIVGNGAPFEPAPGRNWMVGLNAVTRF